MTSTLMIIANVVLDVALTPHRPGVRSNAWRLWRPLRPHTEPTRERAREERPARRFEPALD
jgi:hypothetical protein